MKSEFNDLNPLVSHRINKNNFIILLMLESVHHQIINFSYNRIN
jgi:hypothetical protein